MLQNQTFTEVYLLQGSWGAPEDWEADSMRIKLLRSMRKEADCPAVSRLVQTPSQLSWTLPLLG